MSFFALRIIYTNPKTLLIINLKKSNGSDENHSGKYNGKIKN